MCPASTKRRAVKAPNPLEAPVIKMTHFICISYLFASGHKLACA
jgi:hypothetical protein